MTPQVSDDEFLSDVDALNAPPPPPRDEMPPGWLDYALHDDLTRLVELTRVKWEEQAPQRSHEVRRRLRRPSSHKHRMAHRPVGYLERQWAQLS